MAGWLAENEQLPEWLVRHGAIVLSGVGLAELSSFDDVVRLLVQPGDDLNEETSPRSP